MPLPSVSISVKMSQRSCELLSYINLFFREFRRRRWALAGRGQCVLYPLGRANRTIVIMLCITVSFHNFKSQKFKSSASNPKSKYVAYLSVLSQISNCQGLGRKSKHEIVKTDRMSQRSYDERSAEFVGHYYYYYYNNNIINKIII